MNILSADWIIPEVDTGDICPIFRKKFSVDGKIKSANLEITSLGVYEARLNDKRVGEFIFAPGWTSYNSRIQVQYYDITNLIENENSLNVTVGKGWCRGRLGWIGNNGNNWADHSALIAVLTINYDDGRTEKICTDESWEVARSAILLSEIYDGEIYDARIMPENWEKTKIYDYSKKALIKQEGEIIKEMEKLSPIQLITTPKGEKVIDFGQNITGYVKFKIKGNAGDLVEISHGEVLDKDGNFYTENLRSAKQIVKYILSGNGAEVYKPYFTFQGFRYIRLDSFPGEIKLEDFEAIVVFSDMKRTGYFECSNQMVNKLYNNVIWGQKGNFLDVPTDCPQRDERLGWTGDAQVFVSAAAYNYDVRKFFKKWLKDLAADQMEDGGVPFVIPDVLKDRTSSAWGDAATICPWRIYLHYDDVEVLQDQFESMKNWVEYIRKQGDNEYLWNTGFHFGDWLGMDAPEGSYKGSTDEGLIATAFYAYSASLLIKAGKVLKLDMSKYEDLYKNVVSAFRSEFIKDGMLTCNTQTAHVLALYFNLVQDKKSIADNLAKLIKENGDRLTTGFVGVGYLLHALSENGYKELAYTLLLQEKCPSWLFSVKMGATTIWEHWDGIKEDGSFWSKDMNSFNHYAYGAVADWLYSVVAGIKPDENFPGYKQFILQPVWDKRFGYAKASLETKYGIIKSEWEIMDNRVVYKFTIPENTSARVIINNEIREYFAGSYEITGEI